MEPVLHHLNVPGPLARDGEPRRIAWWEWNASGSAYPAQVVLCVHGLTRQGRDFDTLAQALAGRSLVLCVDVAGRGQSDWLADPNAYGVPTYATDLACLLAAVRQRYAAAAAAEPQIDWVGTSMGGLIGMALAAQPALGLRRLVLNDVGPAIEPAALERISRYVGHLRVYADEAEALADLAQIHRGFGAHSSAQWRALSRPMLRPVQGGWTLHYDPAIALPLRAALALAAPTPTANDSPNASPASSAAPLASPTAAPTLANADVPASAHPATPANSSHAQAALLWQMFDAISARVLLLRGADSDLLSHATAVAMTERGPRARLVEFAGVGHAPTLVAPEQVAVVRDFLLAP